MKNKEIYLQDFISTSIFLNTKINTSLFKKIGLEGFYMLLYLINTHQSNKKEWFPKSSKERQKEVFLSIHTQNRGLRILKLLKLISTERKGMPSVLYYKINYDNIDLDIIKTIPNSEKKEEELKKEITKKRIKKNKYVEYWNNIKHVPTKHKDPSTKLYRKAVHYFNKLENGQFNKNIHLDPKFKARNNISSTRTMMKWNEETIKNTLKELSKIYIDEYWPKYKDKLCKNLSVLLYNPISKTSWFLMAYFNGIRSTENNKMSKDIDYIPFIDKIIKNLLTKKNFSDEDKKLIRESYISKLFNYISLFEDFITEDLNYWKRKNLIDNIVDIILFFEKINRKKEINRTFSSFLGYASEPSTKSCKVRVGSPGKFMKEYLSWMKNEFYTRKGVNITINSIGINSNNWSYFINYLINKYDFDL